MIVYLAAPTLGLATAEGKRRGWHQLAAGRFATPSRHDVRVAVRPDDVNPLPGVTVMMKVGWDEGPPQNDVVACTLWPARRDAFDAFVLSGHARWVDDPDEVGDTGGPSVAPPRHPQAF